MSVDVDLETTRRFKMLLIIHLRMNTIYVYSGIYKIQIKFYVLVVGTGLIVIKKICILLKELPMVK